jgi:DNA-binding transcriptional LysR family regulator
MTSHWHGVELRHLEALTAVGDERSFRGAADRLGYVQSAVSQQISQLEDLVGARLVHRERGHAAVGLTDAGEVLLAHAQEVLSQLTAARADLASVTDGDAATLRVGAVQCLAGRVLSRSLALLYRRRPELSVDVVERPSDADLFPSLARGELDVALAELPAGEGPFRTYELFEDPCVLVVAAGAHADHAEPVGLREVAELPLVGHTTWRFRDLVEAEFGVRGLRLSYTAFAETSSAVQAQVASGRAAAIMPRLAVTAEDPETDVLALDPVLPARTMGLHWHRERLQDEALTAFREAVLDACAERFPTQMSSGLGRRRAEERAKMSAVDDAPALAQGTAVD